MTDLAVDTIEWMDSEFSVLAKESSQQNLTLTLTDDMIEQGIEYICQVTSPFGTQNDSVVVFSCPKSSSVVAGAVSAVVVIVALTVAGIIVILLVLKRFDGSQ